VKLELPWHWVPKPELGNQGEGLEFWNPEDIRVAESLRVLFGEVRLFVCNFSATCEAVCPWGSLLKSCNKRNQLLGTAAGLYRSVCSSPKDRL